jgi:putative sigma-54 modulation protein
MKVEIQSLHFHADQKLKEFIVKKVEKLETYYDRIIDSKVTLSLEHGNTQVKDKVALLKIQIPGSVLIARENSKLFEESVDLAVESIRRQISKYKAKMSQQHV